VRRRAWLLHRYGEQVGVEVTPHQLRHTFARQTVEAGLPLPSLAKLLGHAQVETTQRYSAGADPELSRLYQQTMTRLTAGPVAPPPPPPVSPVPIPTPPPPVEPTSLPPAA
jgi:integrase